MWYKKIADIPEYKRIDPEDDWEESEEADKIFRDINLRYGRDKNISQVAVENGTVIGTIASGWTNDNGYGEDIMVFAFDLVVKPEFRKQGVGLKLIQNAIAQYKQEKQYYQEMGKKCMMRVWVVNPILIPVLERLGFEIESSYEVDGLGKPGSAHLIAY